MSTLASVLLTLTLLLCGGYAGMILMCQIGVLPAMRDLRPAAYADAWRAMDAYLDRRMPPYKGSLLIVNAAALGVLVLQHASELAAVVAFSLLCNVAGLGLTIRQQLPVNARLEQSPPDTADSVLVDLREQTVRGFVPRFWLAAASFVALCVGVMFARG